MVLQVSKGFSSLLWYKGFYSMEKKFKQCLPKKPEVTEVDVIETQGFGCNRA